MNFPTPSQGQVPTKNEGIGRFPTGRATAVLGIGYGRDRHAVIRRHYPTAARFCTAFALALGFAATAFAQITFTDFNSADGTATELLVGSSSNVTLSGNTTLTSAGTFTAELGSVVDLFNATVALPESLTLTDAKFAGTDVQLVSNATLTLQNGSNLTAAAGSNVNLSAANIQFPTTVVLTSGTQTLTGKTLIAPVMSSITSPTATDLSLSGSSSGANLTLRQGSNASTTLSATGNGNINLVPGTSGVVQIGPSANANSFYLTSRTQITGFPAALVQASTPNTITAFDVMPNGSPAEIAGLGWAWLDVCDTDQRTTNTAVRTAHVAFSSSGAEFGSKAFNGASPAPLSLTVGSTKVLQLSTDNSARFIGSVYGGGSPGYLLDSGVTGSPGLWLGQASPTSSNYAILSGGGDTLVNAPTGSKVKVRNANVDTMSIGSVSPSVSSTTGTLVVTGGVGLSGSLYGGGPGGYILDNGTILGSAAGLWLKQSAPSAQNYALLVGSSGDTLLNATSGQSIHFRISNSDIGTISATGWSLTPATQSTSTTTGALIVAGGLGLAGNQFLGGTLNLPGGGIISGASGALSLRAGGTNQGITLTPSGTGSTAIAGPLTSSGQLAVTATTASTSTATGALVVSGGAAIQKKTNLGDDLVLTPTTDTAATVRLSGTTVSGAPGVWLRDGGVPTATNVALAGTSTTTIVNGPTGGSVSLRVANTPYVTVNTSSATIQGVPLSVTATTASISPTTGSATFGGGIGVNGRTSTKTLSVGGGSAVTQILTTISTLNFPSIAANGGVQDLQVSVPGAALGSTVEIVEAGGTFIAPGVLLRAIVTAANTVTVRATNATLAAIDPVSTVFRITVLAF